MTPEKVVTIRWQFAISMIPMVCRQCYKAGGGEFFPHGFAMELCKSEGISPVWKIPYYKSKLRGLIRRHYKKCHPEYVIK